MADNVRKTPFLSFSRYKAVRLSLSHPGNGGLTPPLLGSYWERCERPTLFIQPWLTTKKLWIHIPASMLVATYPERKTLPRLCKADLCRLTSEWRHALQLLIKDMDLQETPPEVCYIGRIKWFPPKDEHKWDPQTAVTVFQTLKNMESRNRHIF